MDFVFNRGNTGGRLSLLHQTIHTYWTLKCVLAKALQILQPIDGSPEVISILQEIKTAIQDIKVSQYDATTRIGRIERQTQHMQQVDMPGSTAKDSAPVDSSDG